MTENHGLLVASGEPFATSAAGYLDAHPEIPERLPRIYVRFLPEGTDATFIALLDTGGHYCILNNDVVGEIRDHLVDKIATGVELWTAQGRIRGELYIHRITLIAELGSPLDIESTVFVCPDWRGPSFLGYTGALDRLRFAIDPEVNRFYFGPRG